MHTSDTLSRLHNFTDTPRSKRCYTFKLLTTFYIEHSYSHLVENLYAHKTKTLDAMTVKIKCGRPPKPKPQIPTSKPRIMTAAKNLTTQPQQYPRSLNNKIVQMIAEINVEWEKSDRLTVAKLNTVKQFNKQDHKSKLMTEKIFVITTKSSTINTSSDSYTKDVRKTPRF